MGSSVLLFLLVVVGSSAVFGLSCRKTCTRKVKYTAVGCESSLICTRYRTIYFPCYYPCSDKCPTDRPASLQHADHQKFYECRDNKAYLTHCPVHSTFNPLAETCVHTPCNIMDGLLQADDHAGRYVMCLAGSMVIELQCPSGTEFNPDLKNCL